MVKVTLFYQHPEEELPGAIEQTWDTPSALLACRATIQRFRVQFPGLKICGTTYQTEQGRIVDPYE